MIRRIGASTIAATAAVAVGAAPAHADDELGLSRDGVTWTTALVDPLFDAGFRFVPGDAEVRSFRVRNDGPSDGVLTVDVLSEDPTGFLSSGDLTLEARVGGGPWVAVAPGSNRVVAELEVPDGARSRVDVRATVAWESTREAESVPFSIRLTLSEDGEVAGVDDSNGGSDDGADNGSVGGLDDLPDTGSALGAGVVWLAAGLVGAGLALVRRGRDRSRHLQPAGGDRP
ncbi:hypothetical protein L615_003700000290 [Nocardioides sp. J9]|uniref:hypothetical protein n=1 Tax=Nocardioides sp. J9 TaxID=935844 RepID=UPI0011A57CCE|nr:hypothetical protein [Nocardioides sp. J9]TWG97263.1 hypothetical protein L615_003700000290 [Nocardioides sp. J9]